VTALDLDGAELWHAAFDGTIGSHGVDGSRVYVTIQEDPSSLIALDPATGAIVWEQAFDGLVVSVLAVAGGRVYVVSQAEGLVAVEAASGDVAWQVELGSVARAGLAISGGLAFVTTEDFDGRGRVMAFR
jgi:outer membrane protein assembly factor BamB